MSMKRVGAGELGKVGEGILLDTDRSIDATKTVLLTAMVGEESLAGCG